LLSNVDHVVVGVAVDELVVGVDAGQGGLLVDDDLKVRCPSVNFSFFR
jgi:hypothetical protein